MCIRMCKELGHTDKKKNHEENARHRENHKPSEARRLETLGVHLHGTFISTASARQAMLHSVLS